MDFDYIWSIGQHWMPLLIFLNVTSFALNIAKVQATKKDKPVDHETATVYMLGLGLLQFGVLSAANGITNDTVRSHTFSIIIFISSTSNLLSCIYAWAIVKPHQPDAKTGRVEKQLPPMQESSGSRNGTFGSTEIV